MSFCINLKQKMNKTIYCKKQNKQITFKDCSNCIYKEFKLLQSNSNQMKNKSKKLAKLEKIRFSVFTDNMNKCYICDSIRNIHIHELIAGRNRINSIKYGFTIPLCDFCHSKYQNNYSFNNYWYIKCQIFFELNIGSRDELAEMNL